MVDPDRHLFVGRSAEVAEIGSPWAALAVVVAQTRSVRIRGRGRCWLVGSGPPGRRRSGTGRFRCRFGRCPRVRPTSLVDRGPARGPPGGEPVRHRPGAGGATRLVRRGRGRVVVVVEDLHWADAASRAAALPWRRAICNTTRCCCWSPHGRFDVRPRREWGVVRRRPGPLHAADALGGLSVADVHEMAEHAGVGLTWSAAERLTEHTLGQPLHVRTLLRELSPAQLSAAGATLPAPCSLAAAIISSPGGHAAAVAGDGRRRARRLRPPGTAGSARPGWPVSTTRREPSNRCSTPASSTWAPQSAKSVPVRFTHPLQRAAVYNDRGLDPQLRRRLHRACGAQLTSRGLSWAHRVAAAAGPDEDLTDELEAAAAKRWPGATPRRRRRTCGGRHGGAGGLAARNWRCAASNCWRSTASWRGRRTARSPRAAAKPLGRPGHRHAGVRPRRTGPRPAAPRAWSARRPPPPPSGQKPTASWPRSPRCAGGPPSRCATHEQR